MKSSVMSQIPHEPSENQNLDTEADISMVPSQIDSSAEPWERTFQYLFDRFVDAYEDRGREVDQLFSQEDKAFLAAIGASPQEIFDFVEDWAEDGEPTPEVIQEVTGIRRDYFLTVQHGKFPFQKMSSGELPSPWASLGGYRWLPRIIAKARAKLHGELPPDIMYGCGRDRQFLRGVNIGLAEFLKLVWEAAQNKEKILAYVNHKARRHDPA